MIKLNQRLHQLVVVLVFAVATVFLLSISGFFFALSNFQKTEEQLARQLLHLIDLKQHTTQANSMLEAWSYRPDADRRLQIVGFWSLIWQDFSSLSPEYQSAMQKPLTALEVGHWRIMENHRLGLHRTDQAIFSGIVQPQITELFQICTAMVNFAKKEQDPVVLGYAADIRGFFTRAAQSLSSVIRANDNKNWVDYYAAINNLDAAQKSIAALSSTGSALKGKLAQFNSQILRFKSNASVLKRLSESANYYSLPRLFLENHQMIQRLENAMEVLVDDVRRSREVFKRQSRQRFLLISTLVLTSLAVLLFGLQSWRNRLNKAISKPIEAIVDNSHRILSSEQTEIELPDSDIEEIQELTKSVYLMRDIVKADQQRAEIELSLQQAMDALNNAMLNSDNLAQFSDKALNTFVTHCRAIAAALFVKPQINSDYEPELCAHVSLDNNQEQQYSLAFDGQPRHSFEQDLLIEEAVPRGTMQIHSALSEQQISFHCIIPLGAEREKIGVLELLFLLQSDYDADLVKALSERLANILQSFLTQAHTRELLEKTQLQKQRLDDALTELKSQTHALQQSEAELEMQADELNIANIELRRNAEKDEKRQKDLEKINAQLQQASRELRKANDQKSAFLSKVSHELRTPLNSIMVLTQILLKPENKFSEEQMQFLSVIRQSGEDLLTLINDLLDLARIEAGKMKFQFEAVRVQDLAEKLELQFKAIAEQRGLAWKVTIDEKVPDTLVTDAQRLSQILRNFLSNAFKFTAKGMVELRIDEQGSYLVFEVEDSGMGISKDDQTLIFESFTQTNTPAHSGQASSGLGLTIAKQISQALGGYITLDSEPGRGSCFRVFIPRQHHETGSQDKTSAPVLAFPEQTKSLLEQDSSEKSGSAEIPKTTSDNPHLDTTDTDSGEREEAALPVWYRQAELTPLAGHDLDALGTDTILKELNIAELLNQVPKDCVGLLLNGDLPLKSMVDEEQLQGTLQALRKRAVLIAIVTESLHNANAWLEGVAHFVIRWNEAGKEKLTALMQTPQTGGAAPDLQQLLDESTERASAITAPVGGGQRILLLDDDMRNLFSLSMALRQEGFETELADSVQMAKEKLSEFSADVVITDLVLPGEGGYSFIEYLNETKTSRQLPVIVMSAKDNQDERERCKQLGVKAYLPKPVSIGDLLDVLQSLVETAKTNEGQGK